MIKRLLQLSALPALAALGTSCASECEDPSRFSGEYEVFSSVASHSPEDPGGMDTYAPFYNGLRNWEILYRPAAGRVRMLIDGQELDANYIEDDENCNRFTLKLVGAGWLVDVTPLGAEEPVNSSHRMDWTAEMLWQGDALTGEYVVTDAWSLSSGEAGVLQAEGVISGTIVRGQ